MIIVQKYGGSSLANAECLHRVASRVVADAKNNKMLVVVSAQGKTTDALTKKYLEISNQFPSRESDALLATGEQASAALLTATIKSLGANAVSLTGAQVPVSVSGKRGDARIRSIETARIRKEWNRGNIVVVTGFQGINDEGDVMTLGRGGSDTSAVAVAAALKADRCMIFTDVDGVYSADPRKVEQAVRFHQIHEDTMLNLAECGAKVLHPRAAFLVKQYNVPTEILTSFSKTEGTVISSESPKQTGITMENISDETDRVTVVFATPPKGETLLQILDVLSVFNSKISYGNEILRAIVPKSETLTLENEIHKILYA